MFWQQILNGLSTGGIYALIAVGFSLIYSIMRFINLAHGTLIMVGAYIGYLVVTMAHLSLFPALVVAAAGTAAVSAIVERVAFRPIRVRGVSALYILVSSMVVSIFLENLVMVIFGPTFRTLPRLVSDAPLLARPINVGRLDFYMMVAAIAALLGLSLILYRTKIGRAMRAVSYNPRAAALMGVNTDVVVSVAFVLAGALAGMAGVFLGIKYSVYPQLGGLILKGFVAAVFGGLGSVAGAVLGGIALGIIEVFLIAYGSSAFSPVLIYGLLVLILLVRPRGLLGQVLEDKA
ncbi:MAG: branched-chain amino acid ABC transporter permease [Firmicutes bacterium]|nr:branched-chain amino acid ABC transporter permease [Bacillota bacterium]